MIKNKLQKFLFAEEAAVITEFVILLPVFIITFVGIVNLNKLEVAGSRVKYVAATQMWDAAMEIHENNLMSIPPTDRAIPFLAANNDYGAISNHESPQGDGAATGQAGGLAFGGSKGESRAGSTIALGGEVYDTGDDFAEDMTKDTLPKILPVPGGWPLMVFIVSVPYSLAGTRHAVALGTRYGMVVGESTRTVTAGNYGSVTAEATYDVLVSPTSVPGTFMNQLIISGFSRLAAEDSDCLKSVLELSNDGDYGC